MPGRAWFTGSPMTNDIAETAAQKFARILLGSLITLAGISHLTFARGEFQAQVPVFCKDHPFLKVSPAVN